MTSGRCGQSRLETLMTYAASHYTPKGERIDLGGGETQKLRCRSSNFRDPTLAPPERGKLPWRLKYGDGAFFSQKDQP